VSNKKDVEKKLSEEELDELSAILDNFPSLDAFNLEELDGFFAAILCGPTTQSPFEHLSLICGEESIEALPFDTQDELQRFLSLLIRHWNGIADILRTGEIFVPLLEERDDDPEFEGMKVPRGNDWAEGFMSGMDTCRDEWQELISSEDEEHEAYLIPIYVLNYEHDPDPELRSPALTEELRWKLLLSLPIVIEKIYEFFKPAREAFVAQMPAERPIRRAQPKVGRNDPCPCGSGRKYKRCCGNATIH
jgi:uncharacterized protein